VSHVAAVAGVISTDLWQLLLLLLLLSGVAAGA
jgi:hypothetical protein